MEDSEIIELFFERDENAIAETQKKYDTLLKSVIKNVLRNVADAEECENDSYIAVWQAIPPQKPQSLRAFLLKTGRNQALKKLRYNLAEKRNSSAQISLDELGDCIFEENRSYGNEELSEIINGFLEGLASETRRIFILRYWYFYPVKEVANQCGISVSKAETVLFRTRKKLKKYLEERNCSYD